MVNSWSCLVQKDSEKSWIKTFPITKEHSKRLIFKILRKDKYIKVELEDVLWQRSYSYTVRTLKDAKAIWKNIYDNNWTFDQVIDRISNAEYYYSFANLDKRHEYDKFMKENCKRSKA